MSLDPARFSLDEQKNQTWCLTVEEGTKLEDVLKQSFLSNVSSQLRPYDKIRVRVDSGEWYAELMVVSCGRLWAKTIPIFTIDLAEKDADDTDDADSEYFVKWRGPHLKWCVVRKSDKAPVKEGMESKSEAANWLASYLMAS